MVLHWALQGPLKGPCDFRYSARVYKVAGTLIFFPTRRGTLISFPNPYFAPRPLNIGKSYIFIAYLGSLKLILLNSIKRAILNLIWPLGR